MKDQKINKNYRVNTKNYDEYLIDDENEDMNFQNKNFKIKKVIKIKNEGNLPVKINKINIDNVECESFGIKILDCGMITLRSGESKNLEVLIKPDFNFYYIEKEIVFFTP